MKPVAPSNRRDHRPLRTRTRCLHTVLFVVFAHPYALITAALALWLLGHFLGQNVFGDAASSAGSPGDTVKSVLWVSGLVAVVCLSIAHLVVVVKTGWNEA